MGVNGTTNPEPSTLNSLRGVDNGHFYENDEYLEGESWGRIFIPIIFAIILVLGVSGNSLVIYSFVVRKQMRTLTNILILNLAIADLLFLVICIPVSAFRFILSIWPFGDVGCKVSQYCVLVSVYVSIYTLVLMAASRYCAIVHPFTSMRLRTKKNIIVVIILTWTICLVGFIPILIEYKVYYFMSLSGQKSICENSTYLRSKERQQVFYTLYCTFAYVLPLTVIIILYGLIVKRILDTEDPSKADETQAEDPERLKLKKRVARMILFVVATFAICWLPFHTIVLVRKYGGWSTQTTDEINIYVSLVLIAKSMAYANSCINPILYTFLSHKFRESFKEALCCFRHKYRASTA